MRKLLGMQTTEKENIIILLYLSAYLVMKGQHNVSTLLLLADHKRTMYHGAFGLVKGRLN